MIDTLHIDYGRSNQCVVNSTIPFTICILKFKGIYIYIYKERERERDPLSGGLQFEPNNMFQVINCHGDIS